MTQDQFHEILQRLTRIEANGEAQARDLVRVEGKVDLLASKREEDMERELRDQRWRRLKSVAAPVGGGGVGAAILWVAQHLLGGSK